MVVPMGFSFFPTDEELISAYLLARVMGLPLPCTVILERDLYGQNTAPCDVFRDIDESNSWYWQSEHHETKGVMKKTIYVFTKLVKAGSNSSRIARRAGSGTWSGQTGARVIKNFNGEIIGSRKMFTFQDSTEKEGGFHWIMHEYSLDGVYKNLGPKNINNDIVLCKITRSFKGKPTTNNKNNGSRLDQIPQQPETTESNGDRYCFPSACVNGGGIGQIPQEAAIEQIPQAAAIENNGDGYCFSGACINGGGIDQIVQEAAIENNGDGYRFSSAWINGGGVDQIPQEAAIFENNGDGFCFSSACINGGGVDQIPLETAIENNGDGYRFLSAWINGDVEDQIPQLKTIENKEASSSSLSGHKRSSDEGVLLEHCEAQVNPKKPRNYDDLWEDLPLADSGTINTNDDLFEGLEDIENWHSFAH